MSHVHTRLRPFRRSPLRLGLAPILLSLTVSGIAQADDRVTLGAGVAVIPRYEGSSEYAGKGVPVIDAQIGSFYARTDQGIGLNLIQTPGLTLSAGANMLWGYGSDVMPRGIGGLSDEVGARLGLSMKIADTVFSVSALQAVTDSDRGMVAHARLAYPLFAGDRLHFTPSIATSWATEKYMDSYFGITAGESYRSGLAQYQPTSGFKDVSARMAFNYALTERLSLMGSVGVIRLVGEAADSPLVEQKTQTYTLIGGSYSF
ncbi:MAG: MipA/OmpV family protein [Castellaniella sp.]|uniref:MipA/OmpV family protein n=1 Tax=Castellaniella sp. TaxID=1955812 RepID=UPI003C775F8B